jgi:hypothetical protein
MFILGPIFKTHCCKWGEDPFMQRKQQGWKNWNYLEFGSVVLPSEKNEVKFE